MEYYELRDLQKYLDHPSKCPNGRLPEREAGSIASQILDALYVMHQHNFSHWDLKPANLLIKQQPPNPWLIKLGDFGISKRGEVISNFTSLAGTIDYMPPEHHGYRSRSGGDDSRAVDMWAFGYTVFRVLTGQGMFRDGQERHSIFSNISPFPDHILRNLQIRKDHIIAIDARCVIAKEQIDEERNFFEAVRTYQLALLVKKKMFGSDDPRILHSMHDLGDALSRYCKFEEAEPICREALRQRRRILGPSNIDTIESLGALVACFQGQENFSEVAPMFYEVVEVRKQFLGPTDKRTVDAMVSLGVCLNREGRVHDAEPILRDVVQIIKREPDSYEKRAPDAVHVLCLGLCHQSRVEEAERLLREDASEKP
ncbi:unnamed protein product, partial [Clonostachys chloroleuca]